MEQNKDGRKPGTLYPTKINQAKSLFVTFTDFHRAITLEYIVLSCFTLIVGTRACVEDDARTLVQVKVFEKTR